MNIRTYQAYGVAAFILWAIILSGVAALDSRKLPTFALFFLGWAVGWLSVTIARSVYPPPRQRR